MNRIIEKGYKVLIIYLLLFTMCLIPTENVEAAVTVSPSGDTSGITDMSNMQEALESDGHIILESGATYYTKGSLSVQSNQTIIATGATIISRSGAFRNDAVQANYKAITNLTVDGGIWKFAGEKGYKKTVVQLTHGSNITIKNATIYYNYEGHAIELIACKNVTIDNCTLKALGTCDATSVEEALQIDIATPKTAPTISSNLTKGQTCQNITVKNCTITGGRGVCANYASKEKKYQKKFHKNVVLKNNKITGVSAEAVALFNVIGATVEKNKITTKSKRTDTAYSVGLHIAIFGKAPSSMAKAKYKVNNNTIKGGRQGFFMYSHSSTKLGALTAQNNKCYAKAGANKALIASPNYITKVTLKNNKTYKWK